MSTKYYTSTVFFIGRYLSSNLDEIRYVLEQRIMIIVNFVQINNFLINSTDKVPIKNRPESIFRFGQTTNFAPSYVCP